MVRLSSILLGSTSLSAKFSNPRSERGTAHAIVIVTHTEDTGICCAGRQSVPKQPRLCYAIAEGLKVCLIRHAGNATAAISA